MNTNPPSVGNERPKNLCVNKRGWTETEGQDPETKLTDLTLVKPGKTQNCLVVREDKDMMITPLNVKWKHEMTLVKIIQSHLKNLKLDLWLPNMLIYKPKVQDQPLPPRWLNRNGKRVMGQDLRSKNAIGNQQLGNSFVNKIRMRQSWLITTRKTSVEWKGIQ